MLKDEGPCGRMKDEGKPMPPEPPLAQWEKDALAKLRLLRQTGKPAILFITESGAIQLYRGERAGLVMP